jgi:hypothetical protein
LKKILIKFRIDLSSHDDDNEGAIFHRWLPDGEKNLITLSVDNPNAKLKVWFERFGFTDDSFVRFNPSRREVDLKIMGKQGCLYSGPLNGLLELDKIPDDIAAAIGASRKGDEKYIKFTKNVIKNIIYEPLHNFIEMLRIRMGQYWLHQMPKFDSRTQSLGYYAGSVLGMKWRFSRGRKWKVLDPDGPETTKATFRVGPPPDYEQYMNKRDWESLSNIDYTQTNGDLFIIRAHRLCDEGDVRLAFIEGVTALELSIHNFIRKRVVKKEILESTNSFNNLPLRSQLAILCAAVDEIPEQQIELAIKAIEIRNDIVHEGFVPGDANKPELYVLLRIASIFSNDSVLKFPSNRFHLTTAPEEIWEKNYKNKHNKANAADAKKPRV